MSQRDHWRYCVSSLRARQSGAIVNWIAALMVAIAAPVAAAESAPAGEPSGAGAAVDRSERGDEPDAAPEEIEALDDDSEEQAVEAAKAQAEAGEALQNRLTIARFSAAPPPESSDGAVAAAIRRAFAGQRLDDRAAGEGAIPLKPRSGDVGYVLADPARGVILERRNADMMLIPASVAKAPTALYALDALGPDYRFRTRVFAKGRISGGVLEGDLYLVGGGDPALDNKDLRSLIRQLKEKGVRRVKGRFIYDESAIPHVPSILPTQPAQARYNPGVSGLSLNFNQVHIRWGRGLDKKNKDARRMLRDDRYANLGKAKDKKPKKYGPLSFTAHASVRGLAISTDRVRIIAAPHKSVKDGFEWRLEEPRSGVGEAVEVWRISKKLLGRRGGRWLPIRKPGAFASDIFRKIAAREGVRLPRPEPGRAPRRATLLAVHESGKLEAILRGMLRFSTNLTAEVVGLTASKARGLKKLELERSSALMSAWADTRFGILGSTAEVDQPPTAFRNHSGLHMGSRLSPRAMTAVLIEASRSRSAYDRFFELLPRYRMRGLPKKAQVRAKTGTVHYGRGLAGYLECPKGKRFAFSYLHSDIKTRKRMDAKGSRAGFATGPWLGRARAIEKKLLVNWSRKYCPSLAKKAKSPAKKS